MRFLNYLKEEYLSRIGGVEVYKNPISDDLKEIVKSTGSPHPEVRFTLTPSTKNVYVWDANHDLFHWRLADMHATEVNRQNSVFGYGGIRNGKIHSSRDGIRYGDSDTVKFSKKEMAWIKSLKLFVWEGEL